MHTVSTRSSLPLPLPRPTKKRRRTATAVLSGFFDPRPPRDFFTHMLNSNDPHHTFNSPIAHSPGILFDLHSHKDAAPKMTPEQRRSQKNNRRTDRDTEERRLKEDKKSRKNPMSLDFIRQPTAQVNSSRPPENSTESVRVAAASVSEPSGTLSLPPSLIRRPTSQPPRSSIHALLSSPEVAPSVPWPMNHGISQLYSTPIAPVLAIPSVPPAAALFPNSPPTPSQSISSYTSRTSSKRLRTPDDDEDLPIPSRVMLDPHEDYPMYYSGGVYSPDPDHKKELAPSSDRPSAWFSAGPSGDFQARNDDMACEPQWVVPSSYFEQPPPHRRRALSVAALLSPDISYSPVPSAPAAQPITLQYSPAEPATCSEDYIPAQSSPEPLAPAIELSHSPPREACSEPMEEFREADTDGASKVPESNSELLLLQGQELAEAALVVVEEPEKISGAGGKKLRDESAPPEWGVGDKGRASKAMRVIESDEELTDLEESSPAAHGKGESASLEGGSDSVVGGTQDQDGDGDSQRVVGISSRRGPPPPMIRRKRPAARKGWKGWVEVEVDESEVVMSRRNVVEGPVSFGERRTRSGRQFDG